MNKTEIARQIKETEEKLAALRKELEKPEYPKIEDSNPGDKLENGCIVVHKMEDIRMALIAAPESTEIQWMGIKDCARVFGKLEQEGFNCSQWFIPNVEQLKLAYKNCKEHFALSFYWSSTNSNALNFFDGIQDTFSVVFTCRARAFSLVSY